MTPADAMSLLADVDHILQFGKLLESGTGAVIDVVIDMADDFLSNSIPAVAAAKQACALAPECTEAVKKLEHRLGQTFFRQTGLWSVVDRIVQLWHAVPKAIRWAADNMMAVAGKARAIISTALDLLNDPVSFIMNAKEAGAQWLSDHSFGVVSLISKETDKIKKLINDAILSIPGASALEDIKHGLNKVLSSLGAVGSVANTALDLFTFGVF